MRGQRPIAVYLTVRRPSAGVDRTEAESERERYGLECIAAERRGWSGIRGSRLETDPLRAE